MMDNNSQALRQKVRRLWIQRLAYGSMWLVFIYIVATSFTTIRQIIENPSIVTSLVSNNEPSKKSKEWALDREIETLQRLWGAEREIEALQRLWVRDFCYLELEHWYRQSILTRDNIQKSSDVFDREHTISKVVNLTEQIEALQPLSDEDRQRIRTDLFYLLGALCLLVILGLASRRTRLTIALPLLEELQLYLPEECVAELHIIKEELEASGKPELYIQLRIIQEYLEVLWSNQVVIRVENLWLPSSKKID